MLYSVAHSFKPPPQPKDSIADNEPHSHVNVMDTTLKSLRTSISPPPSRTRRAKAECTDVSDKGQSGDVTANLAAIEAGRAQITNHLDHFSTYLSPLVRENSTLSPRLPMHDWKDLYVRNQNPLGRHWVIHQHNHPVAGLHYDLRLQINETSSISWAIMYGMPGNANSRRLNRNAMETRVHNLWNHLIETASTSTGSLLIWDTGEYEILPWREATERETDDELSAWSGEENEAPAKLSDSMKLHRAFRNRRIRIRLHGTRLPPDYALSMRLLTAENRHTQPAKPSRKRRRKSSIPFSQAQVTPPTSNLDEDETVRDALPTSMSPTSSSLEREIAEQEDEEVRRTNAYPGADNDIGSTHQRRWYLSMDRYASGFRPTLRDKASNGGRRQWERRREGSKLLGFEPFYVRGKEEERSVTTGRTAEEVMKDEGVEGFEGRKGWKAVLE